MTQAQFASANSFSTSSEDPRLDLDLVPGPEPLPVVGAYGNMTRFYFDTVRYIDKLAHGGYGNVVSFARGMRRGILWPAEKSPGAVFVFGHHLTNQVLIKRADASFGEVVVAAFPDEWPEAARLNGGLLWLHGEEHRQRRKLVTPLFHSRRIQGWRDVIVSSIERRLDRMRPGEPVDLMEATGEILVDFQNRAVLGVDGFPGEASRVGERMVELMAYMRNPLSHFTKTYPFTPRGQMKAHADGVSRLLSQIITHKRLQDGDANDVITMMVRGQCEDGSKLSDEELMAETFGLFLGGWVSTRASMAWTFLMLAQHPQVMSDLYEELTGALQGAAPTMEQLKNLPMLDAVVKESHRLFPPIPLITRVATQEVEIEGYRLPERTEIYVSVYHTHRQPEVFSEPRRFLTERWSTIDPSPYEYLPFGIGSRVCPGNALAVMQMKLMLAVMLQRYRFEAIWDSKIDCTGVGVVAPKPDIRMIVRKQGQRFVRSRAKLRGNINHLVMLGNA